jgi:hypothetical protein
MVDYLQNEGDRLIGKRERDMLKTLPKLKSSSITKTKREKEELLNDGLSVVIIPLPCQSISKIKFLDH